jgi:hypothetical protein
MYEVGGVVVIDEGEGIDGDGSATVFASPIDTDSDLADLTFVAVHVGDADQGPGAFAVLAFDVAWRLDGTFFAAGVKETNSFSIFAAARTCFRLTLANPVAAFNAFPASPTQCVAPITSTGFVFAVWYAETEMSRFITFVLACTRIAGITASIVPTELVVGWTIGGCTRTGYLRCRFRY